MSNAGLVVSIATFLLGHLAAAVWFASHIKTTVGHLAKAMDELRTDLRTLLDHRTVVAVLEQRVDDLAERVERLEK